MQTLSNANVGKLVTFDSDSGILILTPGIYFGPKGFGSGGKNRARVAELILNPVESILVAVK